MCDTENKGYEFFTGEIVEYGDYACLGYNCAETSDGYTVHMNGEEALPVCPKCEIPTGWVKF